ncbi:ADP-ribosylglycohydrolase family protein [Jiangella alba]|uniref:ADP-ribosylglycohydrolase n=1 Tax=Jiangella alba TaxID=561176 RepID=A0A1H5MXJ1_9ACTN|nr:ADP-ribosylglycohydrolase family protein [Jiangella alba]SEE94074.1 ADP-ribosylglycohydrolase [Jiangella alba]
MPTIDLDGPEFYDKVYGCWLGKDAGGTLGGPLETPYGQEEPFDVWWYPELQEGGMPNDDLEMQLAWLKAAEEVGPPLTARDLSRYWLDHIGYNMDEYGMSKTNLRLGLEPPVSGAYNNWFVDCMGCPIRSEIWACITPGAPRVGVRYAYADAICDHAGGESVNGELFNTALECAAFVISDRRKLVDIGLSYIDPDSATARAIYAVLKSVDAGLDWKAARKAVLTATPHYNAQYSPINLGFQVIGLLYGTDFGDGICKTVNCGYDTDSSGASIGSYLGILAGRTGLPQKWIEPLSSIIATNESWGGVRHLSDGSNPAPNNLHDLTVRIRDTAKRFLRAAGLLGEDGRLHVEEADLYADEASKRLWRRSASIVPFAGVDVDVDVDYGPSPEIVADGSAEFVTVLRNKRADDLVGQVDLLVPSSWDIAKSREVRIPAGESSELRWNLPVPRRGLVRNANDLLVKVTPQRQPRLPAVPVVLVGRHAYRITSVPRSAGADDQAMLDTRHDPENADGARTDAGSRPGEWSELYGIGNAIDLCGTDGTDGAHYLQAFFESPYEVDVHLSIEANVPAKFWFNDVEYTTANRYHPIRPNYGGRQDSSAVLTVREGWNELLIKLVRTNEAPPTECHVTYCSTDRFQNGQPQIGRTRFPWDK